MRKVKFWMDGAKPVTKKMYFIDRSFPNGAMEIKTRDVNLDRIQVFKISGWKGTKKAAKSFAMARFQKQMAMSHDNLKAVQDL